MNIKLLSLTSKAIFASFYIFHLNTLPPVFSQEALKKNKNICDFKSELIPDAIIRHVPNQNNPSAHWLKTYQLIYKGESIRQLSFSQFQGYGSHIWRYGLKSENIRGEIIFFKGNYPVRALAQNSEFNAKYKMLLVGLGSDLYYTGNYRWENPELITAANGFWMIPDKCLPRYP